MTQHATLASLEEQFVTLRIEGQLLGLPVLETREILQNQAIAAVPLVTGEIAGTLNLRGRIVTVIDIRPRLGLAPRKADQPHAFIVMEFKGELYSLIVDSVGDVLTVQAADMENAPPNLGQNWKSMASGVIKLERELLVILDPTSVFRFSD